MLTVPFAVRSSGPARFACEVTGQSFEPVTPEAEVHLGDSGQSCTARYSPLRAGADEGLLTARLVRGGSVSVRTIFLRGVGVSQTPIYDGGDVLSGDAHVSDSDAGTDGDSGVRETGVGMRESWALTSTGAPRGTRMSVAWSGDELIAWGGSLESSLGPLPRGEGARYDPLTDVWTTMSTAGAPTPRWGAAGAWTGHEFMVWGGSNGTVCLFSGGLYDPSSDTWRSLPTNGAPNTVFPRSGESATSIGGRIFVFAGGLSGPSIERPNPIHAAILDPDRNVWVPVTTSTSALPHVDWTNGTLFIAGAWTGTDVFAVSLDSFGPPLLVRYRPDLDAWSEVFDFPGTVGTPTGIVWTGSEVVVWSIDERRSELHGLAYEPERRRWRSLATWSDAGIAIYWPVVADGMTFHFLETRSRGLSVLTYLGSRNAYRWAAPFGSLFIGSAAVWAERELLLVGNESTRPDQSVAYRYVPAP